MTPTRKQFKEFIDAIQMAQVKEENLDKAFKLIWDDDQGQYPPFYISPLWEAVYKAFNIMFGLEDHGGSKKHPRTMLNFGLMRKNTTSAT